MSRRSSSSEEFDSVLDGELSGPSSAPSQALPQASAVPPVSQWPLLFGAGASTLDNSEQGHLGGDEAAISEISDEELSGQIEEILGLDGVFGSDSSEDEFYQDNLEPVPFDLDLEGGEEPEPEEPNEFIAAHGELQLNTAPSSPSFSLLQGREGPSR